MDECSYKGWNYAMTITLKGIIDEDFVNYKVPSMTLMFPHCTFKCDNEYGQPLCQNSSLISEPDIIVDIIALCKRYIQNTITEAIVFQGLEPIDSFKELIGLIDFLRTKSKCNDPIIIYTGYNKQELLDKITKLKIYPNIIIKFGRYIPNQKPHYDEVLGVYLASENQYAEKIS